MRFKRLLAKMQLQGLHDKAELYRLESLKYWRILQEATPELINLFGLDSDTWQIWLCEADEARLFNADHTVVARLILVGREIEAANNEPLDFAPVQDYICELRGSNAYVAVNPKYLM